MLHSSLLKIFIHTYYTLCKIYIVDNIMWLIAQCHVHYQSQWLTSALSKLFQVRTTQDSQAKLLKVYQKCNLGTKYRNTQIRHDRAMLLSFCTIADILLLLSRFSSLLYDCVICTQLAVHEILTHSPFTAASINTSPRIIHISAVYVLHYTT